MGVSIQERDAMHQFHSPITVLIALLKSLTYSNGCEVSVTSGNSETLSTVKRVRTKLKVV
jgi:hypothetical protein